jgi:beta-lactamase regulating signal transducer with metallopeptidase domain/HEAT repeat protein
MTWSFFSAVSTPPLWNASLLLLLAKATIILLAALGMTLAMQRSSAGARHLVWLVTLATLLLVPALTAWGPIPVRILPAPRSAAAPDVAVPIRTAPPVDAPARLSHTATVTTSAGSGGIVSLLDGMSGLSIAIAVWASVMLAIVCSLAYSALAVAGIVRRARPLDTPEWLAPLWEVADRFGLEEVPTLLRSDEAKMPFACGLTSPVIVLPAECDGWSLDRRRAVLLHELAHVRRHDLVGHTLGRLVCALYWFHPLAWTAAKQLRSESERACDDLALSCGTRATDYAEHLLDIVTSVRRDATPSVALAMARRKEFEGRMLAILDPQLRRSSPSRRQSAALIAALALMSVVVGAAAPVRRSSEMRPTVTTQAAAPFRDARPAAPHEASVNGAMSATVSNAISSAVSTASSATLHAPAPAAAAAPISAPALRAVIQDALVTSREQKADDRPVLLAKVLRTDTSTTLRRVAAWGLSEYVESPVAVEALVNAVRRDANAGVREMAAWALGHGGEGSGAALDALSAALRGDAEPRVRATSAWALGSIGDRAATDALSAALGDASPDVRVRALWALGSVEPKQAPRAVLATLSDKDPRMRELAAWVLFRIEDPAAVPALEAALRTETDKNLQLADIRALAALGEKSVDALRGLLESPDPRIKSMAVHALAGGHATGPWPWPWPEPRPFP